MSWFQSTNIASLAKNALKEAQKTIDKALDISESGSSESSDQISSSASEKVAAVTEAATDFFASWGVNVGNKAQKASSDDVSQTDVPKSIVEEPKKKNVDQQQQHKRSSSLESSMVQSSSQIINDIPVTLMSISGNDEESLKLGNEKEEVSNSSHHQRSLSDTIFHLTNDMHESVQYLDEQPESNISLIPSNNSVPKIPETDKIPETMPTNNILVDLNCATSESEEKTTATEEDNTLTTVDLNAEDTWSHVNHTEEGKIAAINTRHDESLCTSNNDENNIICDSSWSWGEMGESEKFTVSQPETETEESKQDLQDSQLIDDNQQMSTKLVDIELPDSSLSLLISNTQHDDEISPLDSSSGTLIDQSLAYSEEDDNKMFKDVGPSPPPSFDSPRSSTSPVNFPNNLDGDGSPDDVGQHFELLSNSKLHEPFALLPESSRSSSIVVVSSTRASSGGSGSTAGSTGSGLELHRDVEIEAHHHHHSSDGGGSSSFDKVDPPSSTPSDPTSPEFTKSNHKKGPSSASSSDIEVILSSEYRNNQIHNHLIRDVRMIPAISVHQQTSIELQNTETQTDFVDEEKSALAEEIPKKVTHEISQILAEKDQVIEQLREEGEKLSKKQFDLGQVIKKLRSKEKEMETSIRSLKGELAGKGVENDRLMKSFVNKEASEHNLSETVTKLTTEKRTLELKIEQIQSELEDAKENCASMKASVEDASVEILELKNAISSAQRDSTELDNLTRSKSELIARNESLQKELDSLRSTLNSNQEKASNRESELNSQVFLLNRKVHQLEEQLADSSSEIADATMPLSLEIERLQSELKQLQVTHEKKESQLNTQLKDFESKWKILQGNETSFKEENIMLQQTIKTCERLGHDLEKENHSLKSDLSSLKRSEEEKTTEKSKQITKLETQVHKLMEEVERLNVENENLGLELKSEKLLLDQERKRSQNLLDQLSSSSGGRVNVNQQLIKRNSISNGNFIQTKSGEHSPSSNSVVSESSYLDEVFDPHNVRSMTPKSYFDSFSGTGLLEHLQSTLRQRESEVFQFQEEVQKNEKIRKSLNDEIAKLTIQNHECQIEVERLGELKPKLEELEKNYNALLQMYGEKVEEVEELRLDLQDVKDMYKTQIEQLLNAPKS